MQTGAGALKQVAVCTACDRDIPVFSRQASGLLFRESFSARVTSTNPICLQGAKVAIDSKDCQVPQLQVASTLAAGGDIHLQQSRYEAGCLPSLRPENC